MPPQYGSSAEHAAQYHKAQAADQILAGDSWCGNGSARAFTTGWGEPIDPGMAGWLMTKIIRGFGTSTPRRCFSMAGRSTSPLPDSATQTGDHAPAYVHIIQAAETAAAELFTRMVAQTVQTVAARSWSGASRHRYAASGGEGPG
jgi:hypothetical protein